MLRYGTTLTQIKPLLQLLSLRAHIVSKEEGFCRTYTFPADEQDWTRNPIFVLMERTQQERGNRSKSKAPAKNTAYQLLSEPEDVAQPIHFNRILKGKKTVRQEQKHLNTMQLHFSAILNPKRVADKVAGLKFCPTCCNFVAINNHHNMNGQKH